MWLLLGFTISNNGARKPRKRRVQRHGIVQVLLWETIKAMAARGDFITTLTNDEVEIVNDDSTCLANAKLDEKIATLSIMKVGTYTSSKIRGTQNGIELLP